MSEVPADSTTVTQLEAVARTNDAKTYLEIGIAEGNTFLNVTGFGLRHGVDPKFRLDVAEHESDSVVFFEMTSDDFFAHHADPKQRYDVVFLDGLHTFEQTFRDFCSSQAHSDDGTIWLIDDVNPTDVFSAYPDQMEGLPVSRASWPGGPALARRCLQGRVRHPRLLPQPQLPHDRRQREPADSRRPPATAGVRARAFTDLEQITRMTYYDFIDNRDLMNYAGADEVIDWLGG